MYIGGNFRSLLLLLVVVLPYSFLHVTVTGIRVTYQYQYQYEQQDGHQEDHYQRELSSVPFKESLLPCPKPQGVNLRGRGEAWVDFSRSTIFKHPNGKGEYIFERDMTLRLSNFSNFVSLISYDDKCQLEKLHCSHVTYHEQHGLEGVNHKKLAHDLMIKQIGGAFYDLAAARIYPSTELVRHGWHTNICIGEEQNVTLFDFGSFAYMKDNISIDEAAKHLEETKHKAIERLVYGRPIL